MKIHLTAAAALAAGLSLTACSAGTAETPTGATPVQATTAAAPASPERVIAEDVYDSAPAQVRKRLCYTLDLKQSLLEDSKDPAKVTDASVREIQDITIRANSMLAGYTPDEIDAWSNAQIDEILQVLDESC